MNQDVTRNVADYLRRLENRIRHGNQRICDIDAMLARPTVTFNPFLMKRRKRLHTERGIGIALIREWNRKADAASESVSVHCKYSL